MHEVTRNELLLLFLALFRLRGADLLDLLSHEEPFDLLQDTLLRELLVLLFLLFR